jgi:ferredoxin
MGLRITVDHDLCAGNGQCVLAAPDVFRHNENRQAEAVDPDAAPVDLILEAAGLCPTGAIAVSIRDPGHRDGGRLHPELAVDRAGRRAASVLLAHVLLQRALRPGRGLVDSKR